MYSLICWWLYTCQIYTGGSGGSVILKTCFVLLFINGNCNGVIPLGWNSLVFKALIDMFFNFIKKLVSTCIGLYYYSVVFKTTLGSHAGLKQFSISRTIKRKNLLMEIVLLKHHNIYIKQKIYYIIYKVNR